MPSNIGLWSAGIDIQAIREDGRGTSTAPIAVPHWASTKKVRHMEVAPRRHFDDHRVSSDEVQGCEEEAGGGHLLS